MPGFRDELGDVGSVRDAFVGKPQNAAEEALGGRGDVPVAERYGRVEPQEGAQQRILDAGIVHTHSFDGDAGIGEAALRLGKEHRFIFDIETVDDVFHIVPALHEKERMLLCEGEALVRRVLAVAVVAPVDIRDARRLAERLDQEGVVCPAGTRYLHEPNPLLVEPFLPVERRPDGRVVEQKLRCLCDSEGLMPGMHASLVGAGHLHRVFGVLVEDAPVG